MTTYYNLEVFNRATGQFTETFRVIKSHTIGFVRDRRSGNMIVTWVNPLVPARFAAHRQQIVVLPAAFYRILPEAGALGFAGCTEATPAQLRQLGFVITRREVKSHDAGSSVAVV